jgi:hypothetical protein
MNKPRLLRAKILALNLKVAVSILLTVNSIFISVTKPEKRVLNLEIILARTRAWVHDINRITNCDMNVCSSGDVSASPYRVTISMRVAESDGGITLI